MMVDQLVGKKVSMSAALMAEISVVAMVVQLVDGSVANSVLCWVVYLAVMMVD